MRGAVKVAAVGILFTMPGTAIAKDCLPKFVDAGASITAGNVVVRSGGVTEETSTFRVRNAGSGPCPASLSIARSSTSPSAANLAYSLRIGGEQLSILPTENSPPTIGSTFNFNNLPSGPNGRSVPLKLVIPTNWGLAAGDMTDDLVVQLYDQGGNLVDTLPLTVSISIQPAVELRVVGATGNAAIASIDLGELDPQTLNLSNPFGVRIWSTSPYTVSFRSQNDGALVHSNMTDRINYGLFMNNQQVSLLNAPAASVSNSTTALGDLHPLSVRVKPFTSKAGQYSDRVEVTVSAN